MVLDGVLRRRIFCKDVGIFINILWVKVVLGMIKWFFRESGLNLGIIVRVEVSILC